MFEGVPEQEGAENNESSSKESRDQSLENLRLMEQKLENFVSTGDLLKDTLAFLEIDSMYRTGSGPQFVGFVSSGRKSPEWALAEVIRSNGVIQDREESASEVPDRRYFRTVVAAKESVVAERILSGSK